MLLSLPVMIISKNLQFRFPGSKGFVFPDISCDSGEILLISGNSGAGKTTFLHLLAGLRIPSDGYVAVSGTNISGLKESRRDKFRGNNIGIVFQHPYFIRSLSVLQNLLLFQKLGGINPDKEKILNLLASVNMDSKSNSRVHHLSGGEKQRFSLVRAMVNEPSVLLCDEPTSNLDDHNATAVIDLISSLTETLQTATIVVSHDSRLKNFISKQIHL